MILLGFHLRTGRIYIFRAPRDCEVQVRPGATSQFLSHPLRPQVKNLTSGWRGCWKPWLGLGWRHRAPSGACVSHALPDGRDCVPPTRPVGPRSPPEYGQRWLEVPPVVRPPRQSCVSASAWSTVLVPLPGANGNLGLGPDSANAVSGRRRQPCPRAGFFPAQMGPGGNGPFLRFIGMSLLIWVALLESYNGAHPACKRKCLFFYIDVYFLTFTQFSNPVWKVLMMVYWNHHRNWDFQRPKYFPRPH